MDPGLAKDGPSRSRPKSPEARVCWGRLSPSRRLRSTRGPGNSSAPEGSMVVRGLPCIGRDALSRPLARRHPRQARACRKASARGHPIGRCGEPAAASMFMRGGVMTWRRPMIAVAQRRLGWGRPAERGARRILERLGLTARAPPPFDTLSPARRGICAPRPPRCKDPRMNKSIEAAVNETRAEGSTRSKGHDLFPAWMRSERFVESGAC